MRPQLDVVGRRWLAALGALAAARAVGLVALMSALAAALADAAASRSPDLASLLAWGLGGAALRAGSGWGTRVAAQRAALGVKESLRAELVGRRLRRGGGAGGAEEAALASRGLDGLDPYFRDYLPAVVGSAIVPLAVGLRILAADWVSALILVVTVPLVPLFMILIGLHTAERVGRAQAGLDRLSRHLDELARGLPVLVGLRRAAQQRRALADVSERHRVSTMATLRTAFLSSFALELIATLSVAVVAVFVGVRLVGGNVGLEAGLVALMLAPECFAPLRDLGAAHHASEDGVAALRRVRAALAVPVEAEPAALAGAAGTAGAASGTGELRVLGLALRRGDGREAVGPVEMRARRGEVTVLLGPSGCGKSTVLEVLAGTVRAFGADDAVPREESDRLAGTVLGLDPARRAVIPQAPRFACGTAREELNLVGAPDAHSELEELLPQRLWDAPLERLSPGERRRVAVARGVARARALVVGSVDSAASARDENAPVVLLADEPTAHLDEASAARVRVLLEGIAAAGAAVLVATHDVELAGAAQVGYLWETGQASPRREEPVWAAAGTEPAPAEGERAPSGGEDAAGEADAAPGRPPHEAWRLLPLRSARLWLAVLTGALSVLAGAALSGLSGWLIVQASARPHMMYLMVAIVGVRFFGLLRGVLRYRERLSTHDVVLRWTAALRVRLWDALGADARGWSRLTRPGGALGTLVAEVDELRDALPRVLVPIPAAVLAAAGTVVAVGVLAPALLPIALAAAVLGVLGVPALVLALERRAAAHAALHRADVAERTARIMAAAPDLSGNGLGDAALQRFRAADASGNRAVRRDAFGAGAGRATASLLAGVAAVAAVVVAGAGAGTAPELLALTVMLLLALEEPLGQLGDALRHAPVLSAMLARVAPWIAADPGKGRAGDDARRVAVDAVRARGLSASYAAQGPAVFAGVGGDAAPGRTWAVTGPSGSGKSTLVATLLGFLIPRTGEVLARSREGWIGGGRAAIAWCPQDGYVFDSTLRGNLALARDRDDAPDEDEMIGALRRVGLGPWFAGLPRGLDTPTGAAGEELSGGQRQRLAVARTLLGGAGVVVLDEPTAHLGADEGAELVADVAAGAGGTALVLVTHDAALAADAACITSLGTAEAEVVGADAATVATR